MQGYLSHNISSHFIGLGQVTGLYFIVRAPALESSSDSTFFVLTATIREFSILAKYAQKIILWILHVYCFSDFQKVLQQSWFFRFCFRFNHKFLLLLAITIFKHCQLWNRVWQSATVLYSYCQICPPPHPTPTPTNLTFLHISLHVHFVNK